MPHPSERHSPVNSLLRMRSGQPEEKVELAKKLLDPNYIFRTLRQSPEKNQLDRQLQQALKTTRPKSPLVPRAALHPRNPEPSVKSGSGSDLLEALMAVPTLKSGIDKLKAAVIDKPKQDWSRLSTGSKTAVISQIVLMGGGALTAVLSSKQDRQSFYNLLKDREILIPVPGVPGLRSNLKLAKSTRRCFCLVYPNSVGQNSHLQMDMPEYFKNNHCADLVQYFRAKLPCRMVEWIEGYAKEIQEAISLFYDMTDTVIEKMDEAEDLGEKEL